MQHHIFEIRRPNARKWQPTMSCQVLVKASSLALVAVLLFASGSDAIVKQQRSDDIQPKSSSGVSQQQQSTYQNHQTSANGQNQVPAAQSVASSSPPSVSGIANSQQPQQYSNYLQGNQAGKLTSNYMSADNLAASSANSPEQSYQAAANSVQMALANSGIFNPSQQGGQPSASQVQPSQSSVGQQSNPQHYYYYPSKESSSNAANKAASDLLNNAASSNYQSMSYSNYADQLGSALSSMSAAGPEPAASSQDPSYLPQPGSDFNAQQSNNGPQLQQQQSQQSQNQQNLSPQGPGGYSDMSAYSNNMQPSSQQQPMGPSNQVQQSQSSISFSGPTSGNGMMGPQSVNQQGDYLSSSQIVPSSSNQASQQAPPMSAYPNSNLYNQLGDLSTSNFGNNAGGLSSVASYMAPNQQHGAQQSAHDLFANLGNSAASQSGQFSSAASQLSPAAVSPPGLVNQQQQNSLFGAASSLFNPALSQQQPQQSQQNSLFGSQQYLSSFLSPHQFNQLAAAGSGQQQPLGSSVYDGQLNAAASSPASTSVAPATSNSGKRFGISSFIMPMLALAGLSLLIPTMSNIGTAVGRKKRSIQESEFDRRQTIAYEPMNGLPGQLAKEGSISEYMDRIERYYSLYKNAVESEDCLNRLICEFGDAVKDVTGKSAVVTVIEKLVPTWMTGKVHLFKEAALNEKESGKEKCKKYVCHSNRGH